MYTVPDSECLIRSDVNSPKLVSVAKVTAAIETLRGELVTSCGWICGWFQGQVGTIVQVQLIHFQGTRTWEDNPGATKVRVLHTS